MFPSNFLGVTPAPQYSLNLATNNSSVKPRDPLPIDDCQLPIVKIGNRQLEIGNYLTSTVAPASDNFCLIVSASSFEMPSFTALGAASTRSLASFNPSAVTSRTTLITLILLPPIVCRITSNS